MEVCFSADKLPDYKFHWNRDDNVYSGSFNVNGKIVDDPRDNLEEFHVILMNLYNRCKAMRCLPDEGGMLEQCEYTMSAFDIIRSEISRLEAEERNRKK